MFNAVKSMVMRALAVPDEPQEPAGTQGSLRVFRAAQGYYKYKLALWLIPAGLVGLVAGVGCLGLAAAGADMLDEEPIFAGILMVLAMGCLVALIVAGTISYVALRLDYELRWYQLTDKALRIREGVYQVREMTLTYANIQNISVSQGPLQRAFGISDLVVQTAGGGGAVPGQEGHFGMHLGVFRGVDNAEEIRGVMLERLRQLKSSGLGDEQVEARPSGAGLSPQAVVALRTVRDEARALRIVAQAGQGAGASPS